jgi:hypothetical protein
MITIGFDDAFHDVYESLGNTWRAIWPVPIISGAAFIEGDTAPPLSNQSLVFREDSFDATTRVRRGRLYVPAARPGHQSWALPHPVHGGLGSMVKNSSGQVERNLRLFDQYQEGGNPCGKCLVIGATDSVWLVVAADRISTGERLLTLKARRAFGILPELDPVAIPQLGRRGVIETISMLTEAMYREAPHSVVDRARDAAQSCLAAWAASRWNDEAVITEDLGRLISYALRRGGRDERGGALDAANLIRILHARGKPNERQKRGLRHIVEDDAELALRAVGFLLHEFGWVLSPE